MNDVLIGMVVRLQKDAIERVMEKHDEWFETMRNLVQSSSASRDMSDTPLYSAFHFPAVLCADFFPKAMVLRHIVQFLIACYAKHRKRFWLAITHTTRLVSGDDTVYVIQAC